MSFLHLRSRRALVPITVLLLLLVIAARHGGCAPGAALEDAEVNFYSVLGLEAKGEDATERDIKSAWRSLSKKYHPDIAGEGSRRQYQHIQRAYEVLGDRRKRKVYDILGQDGLAKLENPQQQQQQHHPLFEFFGMGGGDGGGSDRGPDLVMILRVSLQDVYTSAAHTVKFMKTRICRTCRGSGAKSEDSIVKCPHCSGSGVITRRVQVLPGFVQTMQQPCSHCQGKGSHVTAHCGTCHGKGVVREIATISVDMEAGTPEGHILTYELEADQQRGQVPGDLLLTILTDAHPQFKRVDNDLHTTVQLSLKEALLGFEKSLTHLDGHTVELQSSGVTQHGTVVKIAGEGLPRHHVPSERGELLVTYVVNLPATLTAEERRAIEETF